MSTVDSPKGFLVLLFQGVCGKVTKRLLGPTFFFHLQMSMVDSTKGLLGLLFYLQKSMADTPEGLSILHFYLQTSMAISPKVFYFFIHRHLWQTQQKDSQAYFFIYRNLWQIHQKASQSYIFIFRHPWPYHQRSSTFSSIDIYGRLTKRLLVHIPYSQHRCRIRQPPTYAVEGDGLGFFLNFIIFKFSASNFLQVHFTLS